MFISALVVTLEFPIATAEGALKFSSAVSTSVSLSEILIESASAARLSSPAASTKIADASASYLSFVPSPSVSIVPATFAPYKLVLSLIVTLPAVTCSIGAFAVTFALFPSIFIL